MVHDTIDWSIYFDNNFQEKRPNIMKIILQLNKNLTRTWEEGCHWHDDSMMTLNDFQMTLWFQWFL